MTGMPTRTNESPPRQQDEAPPAQDPRRTSRDEVRNFEPDRSRDDGNYDAVGEWMDYPDINTHGSER
jgi:hypothetical protein